VHNLHVTDSADVVDAARVPVEAHSATRQEPQLEVVEEQKSNLHHPHHRHPQQPPWRQQSFCLVVVPKKQRIE
jgi:hypothetical protein